jgi:hypothetical protein
MPRPQVADEPYDAQAIYLLSNPYASGEEVVLNEALSRYWLPLSAESDCSVAIQALPRDLMVCALVTHQSRSAPGSCSRKPKIVGRRTAEHPSIKQTLRPCAHHSWYWEKREQAVIVSKSKVNAEQPSSPYRTPVPL